jgi:hypothetical protein
MNKYHFPIVDGHAHVYKDHVAEQIIDSFSDFYRLEPVALGTGTVSDMLQQMEKHEIRMKCTTLQESIKMFGLTHRLP